MRDEPDYDSGCKVGDVVRVTGEIRVVDSTGTSVEVLHDGMDCRVTALAWDPGAGWRYVGTPASARDLAEVRSQSQSEIGPDWYLDNRPWDLEGHARAVLALREFDPSLVTFSEHDLDERPALWA